MNGNMGRYLSAGVVLHERDLARDIDLLFLFRHLLFFCCLGNWTVPATVVDHIFNAAKLENVSIG
jgi:hypothetical protein